MPTILSGEECQSFYVANPHMLSTTEVVSNGGNTFDGGIAGSIGNRFTFLDGHVPRQEVGKAGASDNKGYVTLFSTKYPASDSPVPKWTQYFVGWAWSRGFGDEELFLGNYDCFEFIEYPGPPVGTSVVGDKCRPLDIQNFDYWICTKSGTSRDINLTADTEAGSNLLVNVSDITELIIGDFIEILGSEYRVLDFDNDSVVLDKDINTTLNQVPVVNANPIWEEQ